MDKEYGGEFSVEVIGARRMLKTNIEKIRGVEGLGQEAFGKGYGESMSSISNYETGMSLLSFKFLLTLRGQYGFSVEEFIASVDIETTKGGSQGAGTEGTGKNLDEYMGAYFIYLFNTSNHDNEHEKNDIEAVHFGVLSIYKKRGGKDTLGVMGCSNMTDSKTKVFRDECSRIFEVNGAECGQRLKEVRKNRRNTSIYYGDLAFSRGNLFINLNSGEKNKAFVTLKTPSSESPKYIGGIGTINSVSKGGCSPPCVQDIGLSHFYLRVNPVAIGERLIFEEINPGLAHESRELTKFFRLLYCNDRPITTFEEETKRRLIQSLMENYIERYTEANLFRTNKVEVERSDSWYKFIKDNR